MIEPLVKEAEWLGPLAALPTWDPPSTHTLLISPHPDDETLGAGGLISILRSRSVQVTVAAVTDGERAYPDMPMLAQQREEEQSNALKRLGVEREEIVRLRLPDSNVTAFKGQLTEQLRPLVTKETNVVAPWRGDYHPDHQACGRAAEEVVRAAGATLVSYFFWTWHFGNPKDFEGLSARRLMLDADSLSAKSEALLQHRSQLVRDTGDPVLPELLLLPARRAYEVFAIGWAQK